MAVQLDLSSPVNCKQTLREKRTQHHEKRIVNLTGTNRVVPLSLPQAAPLPPHWRTTLTAERQKLMKNLVPPWNDRKPSSMEKVDRLLAERNFPFLWSSDSEEESEPGARLITFRNRSLLNHRSLIDLEEDPSTSEKEVSRRKSPKCSGCLSEDLGDFLDDLSLTATKAVSPSTSPPG